MTPTPPPSTTRPPPPAAPCSCSATFAKPTALPPGLDVQIAAMAVSGAGAGTGAFAGSLSLNWIDNTVEAKVSNIAAPQSILAGGKLSVIASDSSTIDSLAGAVAIAGVGASAVLGRRRRLGRFQLPGRRSQRSHLHES